MKMDWEVYRMALEVSINSEAHEMRGSYQRTDGVLRVIKLTRSNGEQVSLLVTDKRTLCYQPKANGQWHPVGPEYLGLALGINRMRDCPAPIKDTIS